jgi:hypothetical protein
VGCRWQDYGEVDVVVKRLCLEELQASALADDLWPPPPSSS